MAAQSTPALSTLLARTSLDDHSEVLNAANAALKKSKTDTEAQHARVVALLKLDRFDDALRALEDGGEKLRDRAKFEWAYALYKSGKLDQAEEAAEAGLTARDGRAFRHVLAQVTYRAEKFDRAAALYKELSESSGKTTDEHNDLKINCGAVDAQLEWTGRGHMASRRKPTREDMEAFELAYNAACGSIARGELAQGEVLLKRAKDLCNAADELSEEEKKAEIMPITVQQIYLLGRLRRLDEAEQLCSSINISEIPDLATRQVAQVNALVSRPGPANPYLSHRIFHSYPRLVGSDSLFALQSSILRQDAYVLELQSLKNAGVSRSTDRYLSNNPSPTTSADVNSTSVLNAAAHAGTQPSKSGTNSLKSLLQKRPNDVGLILTLVQLYAQKNDPTSAIATLESFFARLEESSDQSILGVRFSPGLVGTLVALYSRQGQRSKIRSELSKAAKYWRSSDSSSMVSPDLLKAAGNTLLKSQNEADISAARQIFESLHDRDPSDRTATAGLVASLASTSPEKVTSDLSSRLTPATRLVSDVDAAALEAAGVARSEPLLPAESRKRPLDKDRKAGGKSKKLRSSRMPADFDPNKQLDPERWLPLRDRSTYRPKKKKGRAGATQGGTQGASDDKGGAGGAGGGSLTVAGGGGPKKKKGGKKVKK